MTMNSLNMAKSLKNFRNLAVRIPARPVKTLKFPNLFLVLLLGLVSPAGAVGYRFYATTTRPTLSLNFGNPSNYGSAIPAPVSIDLGPNGTYNPTAGGGVSLIESYPTIFEDNGTHYGGPGDSSSSLAFSAGVGPITYNFASEINNQDGAVGYFTSSSTGGNSLLWFFDQPVTNVYFSVDWTLTYENLSGKGFGIFSASVNVEGFGDIPIYPTSGSDTTIYQGAYHGTVSGVARDSRLAISYGTSFYQGQSSFGDGKVSLGISILADGIPLPQPRITAQPVGGNFPTGGTAQLGLTVTGAAPLSYQWWKNGQPLIGQTDTNLVLGSLSLANSGDYQVVITNPSGAITSAVAHVSIGNPPVITSLPAPPVYITGSNATLSVLTTGAGPLSYQWLFHGTNLPVDRLTTFAGNGTGAYSGDGGAATAAALRNPANLVFSRDGRLLIADTGNQRVRVVGSNGNISTFAGTGTAGYSGDGGAATAAKVNSPGGISFDLNGNLLLADSANHRVRRIGTNNLITVLAGNGTADGFFGQIGDNSAATSANINSPSAAVADTNGNVFIADTLHHRIRKVATNGVITTIAGNGAPGYSGDRLRGPYAQLNAPAGLALDRAGNLLIADKSNNCIRALSPGGLISTLAGNGTRGFAGDGGPATNAQFNLPAGVNVDSAGNVYIADTGNHRIRRVNPQGIISTLAGTGVAGFSGDGGAGKNAQLNGPADVSPDAAGNLYIVDKANHRIRQLSPITTSLRLDNLNPAQLGDYQVIVSSPYGSVTSSIVSLTLPVTIPPPLQISSLGGFPLVFWSDDGAPHTLQSTTNLGAGIWTPVPALNFTNSGVTPAQIGFQITNPASGAATFYRLQ